MGASNDQLGMLTTAAATLPLWASIVIAVVPLVISALALAGGWQQQTATRKQQATEHAASLEAQRHQLAANLSHDREQQARMLEHERHRDDLSEVRGVLDDAARALDDADTCHRDIYDDLGNAGKVESLMHAGRQLDQVKQRLAIRFGSDHEVTLKISACAEVSLQVFGATTQWMLGDYARQQAEQGMTDFEPACQRFISAATRVAGVALPGQTATT